MIFEYWPSIICSTGLMNLIITTFLLKRCYLCSYCSSLSEDCNKQNLRLWHCRWISNEWVKKKLFYSNFYLIMHWCDLLWKCHRQPRGFYPQAICWKLQVGMGQIILDFWRAEEFGRVLSTVWWDSETYVLLVDKKGDKGIVPCKIILLLGKKCYFTHTTNPLPPSWGLVGCGYLEAKPL